MSVAIMERYLYHGCDIYNEIVHNREVDNIAFYAASLAEIITRFDLSFNKRESILESFIQGHPYKKFDIEIDYDFIELVLLFMSYFEDAQTEEQYNEVYDWFATNGIEFMDQFIEYETDDEQDDEDGDYVPSEHEEEEDETIDAEPTDEDYCDECYDECEEDDI